jgi:hypothetical protein
VHFSVLKSSFNEQNYPRRIKISGQGCERINNQNTTINVTSAHIQLGCWRGVDYDATGSLCYLFSLLKLCEYVC